MNQQDSVVALTFKQVSQSTTMDGITATAGRCLGMRVLVDGLGYCISNPRLLVAISWYSRSRELVCGIGTRSWLIDLRPAVDPKEESYGA